ncbi:hypothetical protein M8C21_002650 [Ambrosia artemisiifolia]|uniref:Uncharacterized protein n=1 Tax=Ambrosia artemisiifolia TaxID=4212 RepID=A0AAD5GN96_AMBAR|nr:hypothetical protein M8C21_002650 [Ambrosia artemisiifolia]
MTVAGLHAASGMDSYLGNKERPTTRTASIRKMWRDLENGGRGKENGRWKMSGVIIGSESSCSSFVEGESMEVEDTLRGANGIENECSESQNQMVLQEKEGVRKMFHEHGNKRFEGHTVYSSSSLNSCSRAQWVGENDCKRVRIVREWIESSSRQGDTCGTPGSVESPTQTGSKIEGAQSPIRRIYGRQALVDLLTKFVRERKREVDDLLENRFVSGFAYRHRIQSLLKGRFLRNQRFVEDKKQTSVAASELGFLRQTHAVSDIRKGFLTRLNNYGHAAQSDSDTSSDNEMNNYDTELTEEIVQEIPHEIGENFETTNLTSHLVSHNPPESPTVRAMHDNNIFQYDETKRLPVTADYSRCGAQSDSDASSDNDTTYEHTEQVEQIGENFETTNFTSNRESTNPQEHTQSDSDSDTSSHSDMKSDHIDLDDKIVHEISNASHTPQESHDDGEWYQETVGSDFQESHEEEWYDNGSVVEDPTESWFGENNSYLEAALVTRSNTFYRSDDDDSSSRVVELRELTNRRRVSNLLQSDFGPRLDQLMQSYVSRQDQEFESENEWVQDHVQQQSLDENEYGIDASPQTHRDHNMPHGAADSRFPDSHYHFETVFTNVTYLLNMRPES